MRPAPLARHQADRRRQGRCSQTPVAGWKMKACPRALAARAVASCLLLAALALEARGLHVEAAGSDRVQQVHAPPVADRAELGRCAEAGRRSRRPSVLAAEAREIHGSVGVPRHGVDVAGQPARETDREKHCREGQHQTRRLGGLRRPAHRRGASKAGHLPRGAARGLTSRRGSRQRGALRRRRCRRRS